MYTANTTPTFKSGPLRRGHDGLDVQVSELPLVVLPPHEIRLAVRNQLQETCDKIGLLKRKDNFSEEELRDLISRRSMLQESLRVLKAAIDSKADAGKKINDSFAKAISMCLDKPSQSWLSTQASILRKSGFSGRGWEWDQIREMVKGKAANLLSGDEYLSINYEGCVPYEEPKFTYKRVSVSSSEQKSELTSQLNKLKKERESIYIRLGKPNKKNLKNKFKNNPCTHRQWKLVKRYFELGDKIKQETDKYVQGMQVQVISSRHKAEGHTKMMGKPLDEPTILMGLSRELLSKEQWNQVDLCCSELHFFLSVDRIKWNEIVATI